MEFYRYTVDDFERVPVSELYPGDSIGIGDLQSNRYGAIVVDDVVNINGSCVLSYNLPDEAEISSSKDVDIRAEWEDGRRVIFVRQFIADERKKVLARRRQ